MKRLWASLDSGPLPNIQDKRFYTLAADFSDLLQVPSVDAPMVALSSTTHLVGPPDESLCPEDKRAERTLIKGHQALAWLVRASSAASFFNRASILWLKQLQEQIPASDSCSHQDINKMLAAVEFSADATLNTARFAAKAIGSSVTSRRLLWLHHWQADARNKWPLAASPYAGGKLFGSSLDPILVETKDHRKVFPFVSRRSEFWQQPYFRSQSFRSSESGLAHNRSSRAFPCTICSSPLEDSRRQNLPPSGSASSSRTPVVTVNHLETEWELLTRANIPPGAIRTIQAARRLSTVRIYEATWRTFSLWCVARKVVPTLPSVAHIIKRALTQASLHPP